MVRTTRPPFRRFPSFDAGPTASSGAGETPPGVSICSPSGVREASCDASRCVGGAPAEPTAVTSCDVRGDTSPWGVPGSRARASSALTAEAVIKERPSDARSQLLASSGMCSEKTTSDFGGSGTNLSISC